ncbi:S8 family serine peptidase [Microbispora sp. KK1-11]|uniref:S8 family serine peptidase n=1 Tax=Microbispora sp. KK1-11 TaxID=2053005 RepID=UPI00115A8388|nr:S8 family serine peptidase [Microbispora sp. KK1-11]TQS26730.1 S8 family serine peptidase [Microbispora sp. KK1-11]
MAGLAALGALAVFQSPVQALPRPATPAPRSDEWWFPPWSIQTKVWPTTRGQGVTVAVVDSGVRPLPEIARALLPGGDTTGHGTDGHTDFSDDGHGTGMAILIAGQGGGTTHLVGIAPEARILPVAVTDGPISTIEFEMSLSRGIRFAADHGAQVINISQGDNSLEACPSQVRDAVAYAVEHDVVIVAAAGNDGDHDNPIMFPASCPGVLSVGATDDHSRPWKSTESNEYVSVAAPGVDLPVASKSEEYSYPHASGTSGAAALVSGAAALVRAANPAMPAREVVRRLIGTTLDVDAPGRDDQTGYGIVRINRAMHPDAYPVPPGSPNPPYERFDQWKHPRTTPAESVERTSAAAVQADRSEKGLSTSLTVPVLILVIIVMFTLGILVGRVTRPARPGNRHPDFLGDRGGPGPARGHPGATPPRQGFTMPPAPDAPPHEPPRRESTMPPDGPPQEPGTASER